MALRRVLVANRGEIARAHRPRLLRRGDRERPRRLRGRPRASAPQLADRVVVHRAGRRRPRATSTSTGSSPPRWPPAATRCTPATASSPSGPSCAEACAEDGLVFVGPLGRGDAPRRRQGCRPRAGRRARRPGRRGLRRDRRRRAGARRSPTEIGYPVLLKAAAGGGGRGMGLVETRGRARPPPSRRPPARPRRRSATAASTSSATSPTPATSRCRCSATRTATSSTSATATAPCSAATRSWSRRRPPPPSPPSAAPSVCSRRRARWPRARLHRRRHRRVPRRPRPRRLRRSSRSTPACRSSTRSPRWSPASTSSASSCGSPAGEALSVAPGRRRDHRPRDRGAGSTPRTRAATSRPSPGTRRPSGSRPSGAGVRVDTALSPAGTRPAVLRLAAGQADRARRRPRRGARAARPGARATSRSRASTTTARFALDLLAHPDVVAGDVHTRWVEEALPARLERPTPPSRRRRACMAAIEIVDQTLRDGQQSLWGMRMRAGHDAAGRCRDRPRRLPRRRPHRQLDVRGAWCATTARTRGRGST